MLSSLNKQHQTLTQFILQFVNEFYSEFLELYLGNWQKYKRFDEADEIKTVPDCERLDVSDWVHDSGFVV